MMRGLILSALIAFAPVAVSAQAGLDQRVIGEFVPSRDQTSAALGATAAFWDALERGDFAIAYGLLSAPLRAVVTPEQFVAATAGSADFGVPRRVMRLTWYHEQPQHPGTVLAVDWQARDGDTLLGGGYLIWQLQPDGGFALHRLDTTDLRAPQ